MSASNNFDNLSGRVHSHKCADCKSCFDYMSVKDDQLIFKCSRCSKNHSIFAINRFASTNKFWDGDINKFILLLRKGVYPYEYMNNWETFDEILLSNKEGFYGSLNMEGTTDLDYRHAKKSV